MPNSTVTAPATVTPVPPATFVAPPAPTAPPATVDPDYAAYLAQKATAAPTTVPSSTDEEDPFSGPAPQRPRGPRMREMNGRLLLITPLLVQTVPNKKSPLPGATQERMTADVVILDGGIIHYGGRPEAVNPTPHTMTAQVPMRVSKMFISAVGVVSQCEDALARRKAGKPGAIVLGRLGTGEARDSDSNPPYLLSIPTEEEKAIARHYLRNVDPFDPR
jgi:hypothetical protein